ncbi:MAG: hypothetical protein COW18_00935 [Zetaproteobacteria bacterium CG12_big_fil_rev_8_21_14_0_65_54_13]|nr:MAG: hypothetical protein COW18_00935 [Zetaproteobacteria bacterium CG12_big_fil_rev_8_21_14_0_65_54_13]PIX55696.1 MAG: hypothetical protein COZ50_01435 [Zetaproteobacteria bacterium CG_4_10_14_3_um_filter_54_28]PJA29347.1 MAG: hypothetical protein CO188_06800 [Zetaproteobacteria bacterium CG_4_9_14_3_um_filter_54_145]
MKELAYSYSDAQLRMNTQAIRAQFKILRLSFVSSAVKIFFDSGLYRHACAAYLSVMREEPKQARLNGICPGHAAGLLAL